MRGLLLMGFLAACGGSGGAPGADLSGFPTARILVGGVEFEVFLATTFAQQAQGLMDATASQIAPLPDGTPRGMLFVFPDEATRSFWMRDTYVPLDLAYATADGIIVEIFDLLPLDEAPVTSGEPVQYALEVPAGTLAAHGIAVGSVIVD
ncbi:MAG TPA: DUF192 domain-containing protein [Planctomycetota bacterium]|nr:DUF192 domain-containing protein [Planctomycetota bacterium]